MCCVNDFVINNGVLSEYTGTDVDVVIPNGVTGIGDSAFEGCSGLTSIVIPDSVTGIGGSAFSGCSDLTSITIPDSVTSIGDSAFEGCSSLTSIMIPDSVTDIGNFAFEDCSDLTSIIVAKGNPVYHTIENCMIETMSKTLIAGCCSSVIPVDGSVTSIGDSAFSGCSDLTSITIPDSVTSIGDSAFWGCSDLTSITIPDSVTSIEEWTFSYCSSLTNITIPNSVTSIGKGAFMSCRSLMSITIPDSVTSIGNSVFNDCTSLTSIIVTKENPVYHTSGNCMIETMSKTLIAGCCSSVIPADGSVTSIGRESFRGCSNLTSITIPGSVTRIGWSAFSGCSLTSITIPGSVTSIEGSAFWGCSGLTSITISDSVICIDDNAFGYTSYYKNSANWENGVLYIGRHLISADPNVVTENCTIKKGTRSIASSAFSDCCNLTSITIPDSVTNIGGKVFFGCNSLVNVTWPSALAKELNKNMPATKNSIILHIDDISNVSAKFRPAAAAGFVEDNRNFADENGKKYLKYIKSNVVKLAGLAVAYPALFYLMLREKLITAKDLDAVTSTVQENGNAEMIAAILTYGNSSVSESDKAKVQKKKEKREEAVMNFVFDANNLDLLSEKKFAVVGKLKSFSAQDELKECLEACNAMLVEELDCSVHYLITNEPDSGTAKIKKAVELGIQRITEAQFNEMIGRTVQ